jgi:hypothetical protein
MPSVADAFRSSLRERIMALTADERVALTARLAEADAEIYGSVHGVSRGEAARAFQRRRTAGRRRSCANEVGT